MDVRVWESLVLGFGRDVGFGFWSFGFMLHEFLNKLVPRIKLFEMFLAFSRIGLWILSSRSFPFKFWDGFWW